MKKLSQGTVSKFSEVTWFVIITGQQLIALPTILRAMVLSEDLISFPIAHVISYKNA